MKVKSLSRAQLLATPWTAAHQAPPSMGFSGQEYWSGLPLPSSYLINSSICLLQVILKWTFTEPYYGKAMTNLGSILKSRDMTLPTKVHLIKAMVMYGCESWTIKSVECRRIDAFELWCWRRLLRVPWTARRSNQLILK